MTDRGPPESGFLNNLSVGERGIDAPAAQRRPVRIWITVAGVGASAWLSIVGEPPLSGRKIEALGLLDQRMMFDRIADFCLVPKHFLRQRDFADLCQLDRPANVG